MGDTLCFHCNTVIARDGVAVEGAKMLVPDGAKMVSEYRMVCEKHAERICGYSDDIKAVPLQEGADMLCLLMDLTEIANADAKPDMIIIGL